MSLPARSVFPTFFLLPLVIALAACSGGASRKQAKFEYIEQPVEQLYLRATDRLDRGRYDEAVPIFEEVERQHPYSDWARRAMLMKAFARYQTNDYDEAIAALDQFIALHQGNQDTPYAYYLKAMSFYERIRDVGRDQDFTKNAVAALTDVIRRYPQSEYARDSRLKLDLTYDHLAGKEMYVGRFYMTQNKHIAAINRFKYVINNYQRTTHVPEALHRLVEAYLQIGIETEARAAAAVLAFNYPGDRWYQDTYSLLKRNGMIERWAVIDPSSKVLPRPKKEKKASADGVSATPGSSGNAPDDVASSDEAAL
ncbi:MAG: outer membrane protein assembly factor BamD [Pseudomonadota bacterium]